MYFLITNHTIYNAADVQTLCADTNFMCLNNSSAQKTSPHTHTNAILLILQILYMNHIVLPSNTFNMETNKNKYVGTKAWAILEECQYLSNFLIYQYHNQ